MEGTIIVDGEKTTVTNYLGFTLCAISKDPILVGRFRLWVDALRVR
jgi:hypothetical protein